MNTGNTTGMSAAGSGGFLTREKQLSDVEKRINECEKGDKGDTLAEDLLHAADHEHKTGKQSLQQTAQFLSLIQDYRQTEIERLEHKVVQPLQDYKKHCKQAKNDLKATLNAYKQEKNQHKKVEQLGTKEQNINSVSKAQSDLRKTKAEADKHAKVLDQGCHTFEERRVADMRQILHDFVHIEMMFHAKALEIYTSMYRAVDVFDVEQDLEEFRQSIRPPGVLLTTEDSSEMSNVTSSSTAAESASEKRRGGEDEDNEEEGDEYSTEDGEDEEEDEESYEDDETTAEPTHNSRK